ncbi:MAG: STAS domain-containing protein [Planctomycetota bacterium]
MSIAEYSRDSYQLIVVTDILDGKTEESEKFQKILDMGPELITTNYMIKLDQVAYINSSMLGLLVKFLGSCQAAGKNLILIKPSSSLLSVFDMIGLSQLITTVETEEEGCGRLGVPAKKHISTDIDYDVLSDEIEEIISAQDDSGDDKEPGSELRKLLG